MWDADGWDDDDVVCCWDSLDVVSFCEKHLWVLLLEMKWNQIIPRGGVCRRFTTGFSVEYTSLRNQKKNPIRVGCLLACLIPSFVPNHSYKKGLGVGVLISNILLLIYKDAQQSSPPTPFWNSFLCRFDAMINVWRESNTKHSKNFIAWSMFFRTFSQKKECSGNRRQTFNFFKSRFFLT